MVGRRKLPIPLLNCIFNFLLVGVQYTLSCHWTSFGLKCLLWIRCGLQKFFITFVSLLFIKVYRLPCDFVCTNLFVKTWVYARKNMLTEKFYNIFKRHFIWKEIGAAKNKSRFKIINKYDIWEHHLGTSVFALYFNLLWYCGNKK